MRLNEFQCWLDGFEHAFKAQHPNVKQWSLIKSKLEELEAEAEQVLEDDDAESDEAEELHPIDAEVMENLCGWLHKALEKNGGKPVESSISQFDGHVVFEMDGCEYVAAIRPIVKSGVAA